MNKKILVIIIVVVVLILAGVIYFSQQPSYTSNYQPNTSNNSGNTPSSQPTQPSNNTNPTTYNVIIQNFAFSPASLTIKAGDTVTWTNRDSAPHQPSGNGFQSGVLSNGQSFSFTFNTAGTFNYICNIHTYMKGIIIVN